MMKRAIIYLGLSIALLVAWQYFGSTNQTVRLLLSSPSLLTLYFIENAQELIRATGMTMIEAMIGLIIATVFSFAVMILCFYRPSVMAFVMPLMVTSQVIPLIVLAPFFIILLGIGISSKIAMSAVISFFPIYVNFALGFKSIGNNIHELMDINNASLKFRIWNVYFPLSAGNIIAGMKISASLSIIGAIVAEFSGAEVGLGKNLYISALRLEPELMMCSLLLSIVIGLLFYSFFNVLERTFVRWL